MQLLSLFCGAGGLDLGFKLEGFDIKLAIDHSEAAIATHSHNFPESVAIKADLIELGVNGLIDLCAKYLSKNHSLGIIGGPPCQGFSRGNQNSNSDDPRNKLALLYIDFIAEIKKFYVVEFIVFENVLGLKDKKHKETYNYILERLGGLDLNVTANILNAKDYGVAQDRKRVIIIAMHKSFTKEVCLKVIPGSSKTVKDVIYGLPQPTFFKRNLNRKDINHHPNHWTMVPKSIRFNNPQLFDGKTRSFRVVSWDKPSPTIAYGNREIYVHPDKTRRLTIYESMLLQGFPLNFEIKGTFSQQVTQVSNAVPPPMAQNIAKEIKKTQTWS